MSSISGAIRSLMLIPMPVPVPIDWYGESVFDDKLFMAVITDMISLNEEMISEVEDVFFACRLVPEERLDTDEIGVERFVIMHLFYR
jgi:hypothetical protein